MPWKASTAMSQGQEFVELASQESGNIRALCRQFGITPRTGYQCCRALAKTEQPGCTSAAARTPLRCPATPPGVGAQPRPCPDELPPLEHEPGAIVRMPDGAGRPQYQGQRFALAKPFETAWWPCEPAPALACGGCTSASSALPRST